MRVWPGELPSLCPLQTVAAAGTPTLSFWGAFSLPLSFLLGKTLPPAGGSSAWPLCLPLRWRNQLRLSFFQGDHHLAPCSCRAPQAPLDRLGLLAPSAALAWRFSSTSLSTCRVSAGPVGQYVCARVHVCMGVRNCMHICVGGRPSVWPGPGLPPLHARQHVHELLSASCPHT